MESKWQTRIPELDGVRAIAIWMVLFTHVIAFDGRPALSFLPRVVREILGHGWLGVDLFFLLSGFLISGILLDGKKRSSYFKTFYTRRFFRIIPLYSAVVIIWSLAYHGFGSYFALSSIFGANLAPLFHVRTPHGPGVLWSLTVEEHFYLLWPAIVFLLSRRKVLILCALIVLGSPILRGIFAAKGMIPNLMYQLSWFRFDGLAAGAAMAIWVRSEVFSRYNSRILAFILICFLLVISIAGFPFGLYGTATVAAVALRYTQAYLFFGALFVLTLVYRDTPYTAFLRMPFMQLSGALSYCVYLIHLSLGDFFLFIYGHQRWLRLARDNVVLLRAAFMIGTAFAIALLSRKYLEEPFLALKDRFAAQQPLAPPDPQLSSLAVRPSLAA